MKKLLKPFALAFATAALFSACSNDEPANTGNDTPKDGMTAYLKVNVQAAGGMGRGTDAGYLYGNADEHAVANAHFYFFDAQGLFMLEASVWNDGYDNGTPNTQNVEYFGNSVLVLEGLKPGVLPSYLLTVLNAPDGFAPQATIDETRKAIVAINDDADHFVMSTSSYFGVDPYGVNALAETDFMIQQPGEAMLQPNDSGFKAVNIYVERLAAKVEVITSLTPTVTLGDVNYYQINTSVGGNGNNEGADYEGVTELYVKFGNWGLSGTAPNSYMSKNIDGFTATSPWTGWNNANDYRSFWAKSVVYEQAEPTLNYIRYDGAAVALGAGNYAYCPENTNTAENITKTGAPAVLLDKNVTSVIFTATVVALNDTKTAEVPVNLARFNGVLYTWDQLKAYALNNLNARNKLNYWKKDVVDGVQKYKQLDATDLALTFVKAEGQGTGMVKLVSGIDATAAPAPAAYYVKGVDSDNKTTWTETAWTEDAVDALNAELAKFYNETESYANAYTGGAMFYSKPIEHLVAFQTGDDAAIVEGNYGVVRNHWYQMTVNAVTTIGHGVFQPGEGEGEEGEPLIPDDPNDPTYYLGAKINVLSWKVVTQSVGL